MNELSFNLYPPCTLRHFVPCFDPFHRIKCHRLCAHLPQTMHLFTITHLTLYYQQHQHSSLLLKLLPPFPWLTTPLPLRGGAGGEALFALHHFPFHYQQHYTHDCFTTQLRWYCAIIPMDECRNINALTTQLGTSCSFDSPGLARNEPTPGERSQGDSTP